MRHSLGHPGAVSAGFAIAACIAVSYWVSRRLPAQTRFVTAGTALGALSFPLLCLVVASAGLLVGLEPLQPMPALRGSSLSWVNALLLAPLFEEVLYRSLLIDLLRPRIGLLGASAVSTALFAASHLSPWGIVSGVVVGSFLAAVMARTRRLDLCVGLHAGLNLASLGLGTPPPVWAIAGSLGLIGAGAVELLHRSRFAPVSRS
jgi:membrane protease YdiL (CAAX protease family)